ncbi:tyrosine-type recombinase/integrase [Burkholderia aenigmatica]|uniref:Integrase n=1 Tax=Burkholderia aenigmatica TaxID=2015348 RepID=A0A228II88_9BURK|nr:site-specific integrase [Burkholderia aenigmatica]OXI42158.1 integrase [Burkholderia aenigmatica]
MASKPIHSKTARAKLAPAREPYWARIRTGLHVGYRKLDSESGTWIGRRKGEDGKYQFQSFGENHEYDTALVAVQKWADELGTGVAHDKRKFTVADVCRAYVEKRRDKGTNSATDAELRFKRLVYGKAIGDIQIAKLRYDDVLKWRNDQLDGKDPDDEESYNRAMDTVNRELTNFKAALNYGKNILHVVSTDIAWKGVTAFPKVGTRRQGFLTAEERQKLLCSMRFDLYKLAIGLLLTGARPGELVNADVRDFDKNLGKLALTGKTGKRLIPLSDKAREFFRKEADGRPDKVPLLVNMFGERWYRSMWVRLFQEAREKAELPDAVMYCLRHTYISEALAQGIDPVTVANLTGTSVKIIQKHYHGYPEDIEVRLSNVALL